MMMSQFHNLGGNRFSKALSRLLICLWIIQTFAPLYQLNGGVIREFHPGSGESREENPALLLESPGGFGAGLPSFIASLAFAYLFLPAPGKNALAVKVTIDADGGANYTSLNTALGAIQSGAITPDTVLFIGSDIDNYDMSTYADRAVGTIRFIGQSTHPDSFPVVTHSGSNYFGFFANNNLYFERMIFQGSYTFSCGQATGKTHSFVKCIIRDFPGGNNGEFYTFATGNTHTVVFENCLFENNTEIFNMNIYGGSSSWQITNCTFDANPQIFDADVTNLTYNANYNFRNNIFSNNTATFPGNGLRGKTTYSLTSEDVSAYGAGCVRNSDPKYLVASGRTKATDWKINYTTSPAVGIGTTTGAPSGDMQGNSRGSDIDAGCWQSIPPPPVLTGLGGADSATTSQTDSTTAAISYEVTHTRDNTLAMSFFHQLKGVSGWTPITNTAGDTGEVDTSSTEDKTATWNIIAQLGKNIDTLYKVRILATDNQSQTDSAFTRLFRIDTKNPTGLSALQATDSTATTVTLQWDTGFDNHFHHYEIYYGINKANVLARGVGAVEWDQTDDPLLRFDTTSSTTITALQYDTKYYFAIWAVDSGGNEMTTGPDSVYTLTSPIPFVTGWDPDADVTAAQYDSNHVRIAYEAWDTNDTLLTIRADVQVKNGAWMRQRVHVSGDTGLVAPSLYTDRSVIWSARDSLGPNVDTVCYARIIATDYAALSDTSTSVSFIVDTKDPTSLANLQCTDSTTSSIKLKWTVAVESHFNHYEIWYGTDSAGVANRSGAAEWDHSPDDPAMGTMTTDSTIITGLLANTRYFFKIWAVDNYGNESTTAIIKKYTKASETLQITNIADNMMAGRGNRNNFNYGASTNLGAATAGYNGGTNYNQRTLVRIDDISSVPGGATIDSAIFRAYCNAAGNTTANTISCYRVLRNWNEGTGTGQDQTNMSNWIDYANEAGWATAGCGNTTTDRKAAAIASASVTTAATWYNWNITAMVRDWCNDTSNQGMVFIAATEANPSYKDFNSGENGTNPPRVDVYYRLLPPSVSGPGDTMLVAAIQHSKDSATIRYKVTDPNNATVTISAQYKVSGGSWSAMSNTLGSTGSVDTSGTTVRVIKWGVRAQLGGAIDGSYYVRVIANDGKLKDTTESPAFGIDTKAPRGLGNFHASDTSAFWIECAWDVATSEGHFHHYEIYFDSVKTNVENRSQFLWDGADDNALFDIATPGTRITGLVPVTRYYFKLWAVDSMGNDTALSMDSAYTKASTLKWNDSFLGPISGGALTEDVLYIGTGGGADSLRCINLANGALKWGYSTSPDDCRMPTCGWSGGKYKVIAAAGNTVHGRQDDGATSSEIFTPINLGAAAGNPYVSIDDTTFFVTYGNNITHKKIAAGAATLPGWPQTLANLSKEADMVVYNDEIYVATNDGLICKYDFDGTQGASYNVGASVDLPLLCDGPVLFITPDNDSLFACSTSTMAPHWTQSVYLGAPNRGPAFTSILSGSLGWHSGIIYVAAGKTVKKITESGSTASVAWTSTASDTVRSGPILYNNVVYFGCDGGYYYAVSDADGAVLTDWPYTEATGNATSGPWIDIKGRVIFGTDGGDLDAFDPE